jgi:hypothetical protein
MSCGTCGKHCFCEAVAHGPLRALISLALRYPPGPGTHSGLGVIMAGAGQPPGQPLVQLPHGSQGAAQAGVQGWAGAPRNSFGQHPQLLHPAVVNVSIAAAVRINSLLISRTSLRNGLVPSWGSSLPSRRRAGLDRLAFPPASWRTGPRSSPCELYTKFDHVQTQRRPFSATSAVCFFQPHVRIGSYTWVNPSDRHDLHC